MTRPKRTSIVTLVLVACSACTFSPQTRDADTDPNASDAASSDASSDAVAVADAEADGASVCTMGLACDDQDVCTEFDTCFGGGCAGIRTNPIPACTSMCGPSCSSCGVGACCVQDCPSGACPACAAGCDCDLSCRQARPCDATCTPGSQCYVDGSDDETDGDYKITCQTGSSCAVNCVGDEGSCTVTCEGTAQCLVIDAMQAATSTLACASGVIACSNNIKVCNRPCPA